MPLTSFSVKKTTEITSNNTNFNATIEIEDTMVRIYFQRRAPNIRPLFDIQMVCPSNHKLSIENHVLKNSYFTELRELMEEVYYFLAGVSISEEKDEN